MQSEQEVRKEDEKKKWKPIMKITRRIEKKERIDQLGKYYNRYEENDQKHLEDFVINYLLNFKCKLLEIKGSIGLYKDISR